MPSNPVTAGRKGGQSRSEAKVAAAKRNGFQRSKPSTETETTTAHTNTVLFVQPKRVASLDE